MTYYLKYRPQTLDELDLTQVRESLTKIVRSKKIPHAFLFSGPRGTGKTSAARILAKIINCESTSVKLRGPGKVAPCGKCSQCISITKGANIDIIELDAASHRGIDDMRTLRDAVKLTPARAKTKVYIIDEAHMLTTEASNALLKTLEEPPEHVMFILATTNPEKLIETIRSRTTNIVFKKATDDEILRSLKSVKKGEKLKIDDDALRLIAKVSDGSFRDAVKTLEQLVSEIKTLSAKNVEKFLGKGATSSIEGLFKHLSDKNTKEALLLVDKNISSGADAKKLGESILEVLRKSLRAKFDIGEDGIGLFEERELVTLIELFQKAMVEILTSSIEHLPLELAIIKWCENITKSQKPKAESEIGNGGDYSQDTRSDKVDSKIISERIPRNIYPEQRRGAQDDKAAGQILAASSRKDGERTGEPVADDVWKNILGEIRPRNSATEALLRAARPSCFDGQTLTLGVYYSFHKEQLESVLHRRVLEDACGEILGNKVSVICELTKPPEKPKIPQDSESVILAEPGQNNNSNTISPKIPLTGNGDGDIMDIAKEIFGDG